MGKPVLIFDQVAFERRERGGFLSRLFRSAPDQDDEEDEDGVMASASNGELVPLQTPVSFKVLGGEVVSITSSVSGRLSTLAKISAGFAAPTSGCVKASGPVINTEFISKPIRGKATVYYNLLLCLTVQGISHRKIRSALDSLSEKEEGRGFMKKKAEDVPLSKFSSLALAVAVLSDPAAVIITERFGVLLRDNGGDELADAVHAYLAAGGSVLIFGRKNPFDQWATRTFNIDSLGASNSPGMLIANGKNPGDFGNVSNLRLINEEGAQSPSFEAGKPICASFEINLAQDRKLLRLEIGIFRSRSLVTNYVAEGAIYGPLIRKLRFKMSGAVTAALMVEADYKLKVLLSHGALAGDGAAVTHSLEVPFEVTGVGLSGRSHFLVDLQAADPIWAEMVPVVRGLYFPSAWLQKDDTET